MLYGIPVTSVMEAYNMCQLQPDPGYSDDNNYMKNAIAEAAHLDIFGELPGAQLLLPDGTDVTGEVMPAFQWLKENSF